MKIFLNNLRYGWSFMRALRLILGVILLVEAVHNADWIFGIMSVILLLQSFFNVTCRGGGACDTNQSPRRSASPVADIQDTIFTEVK